MLVTAGERKDALKTAYRNRKHGHPYVTWV